MTEIATHEFMLQVAEEAIGLRAQKDGYEPSTYDAQHDPEGYITSLLNALHQWCHVNGIDWEGELARAQGFFEQDLAEISQQEQDSLPDPTIQDLRCPQCGHEESFVIEVSECLLMFADGVVLHGDSGEEWGDWSSCRCHECCHRGTVYQFRKPKQEEEVIPHG